MPVSVAWARSRFTRAFEIAAVRRDRPGDVVHDLRRHVETGMGGPHGRQARREDRDPQLLVERADLDHKAACEARADPLVQRLKLGRRTVGGDDDLTAGIDQRVDRVAELGLDRLALDELNVVEDEQVDAAQPLLVGERGLRLQGIDETVHEAVGGQVDHPATALPRRMADAVQQMRLAEATPAWR